jgi:hypothetical protein
MKKILTMIVFIFLIFNFNLTNLDGKNLTQNAEKTINLKISNNTDTWMKIISTFNPIERGISVQQTNDKGFIINGFYKKDLLSAYIMWLIKTDENGNIQWSKEYEGIHGEFVQQTDDNGYIIISDVSLIKTDDKGDIQWKCALKNELDKVYFGRQTDDGGYIITGCCNTNSIIDLAVIKTDENGILEWKQVIGSEYEDKGIFVSQTRDDGFIIVGQKGFLTIWLIKLSSSGDIEWDNTFSGNTGYTVEASSVQQTTDGGYIIFGNKGASSSGTDIWLIWLIKTDDLGNKIWDYTFGSENDENCYSGQETNDNGFIMIGSLADKYYHNKDIILIKADKDGNLEWKKTYGTEYFEIGYYIQKTYDGGYIFTGFTDTGIPGPDRDEDLLLIKTDENGEFIVSPKYPYKIDGPINCKPSNEYTYKTKSLHWEDKKMRFGWDWNGDEIVDEWTEKYYETYEDCIYKHTWENEGSHIIKVIAEDEDGAQSEWSETLIVSASKNKLKNEMFSMFLNNFLEKHSLLLSILRQMSSYKKF